MKQPVVGVDIDGVLANFCKGAREICKTLFNGRPPDNLVQTSWSFESLGISNEEEKLMWRTIDSIPNWWTTLERLPHTNYLRHLCDNARVLFITNRKNGKGYPIEVQSADWLKRTFQLYGSSRPNVLISDNKGLLAAGLKLDYFVDDRPKNVEEVVQFSPETKTYLLNAPYNKECRIQRVDSLDEFVSIVLPLEAYDSQGRYHTNGERYII